MWHAQADVEANTLTVLAFRYTSITSVAMLDAFSIPSEYGVGMWCGTLNVVCGFEERTSRERKNNEGVASAIN